MPIPDDNNVWALLTSCVCFCTGESDGRHVGVLLCVWRSVTLSVVLATLQSIGNELQLQALPPNGGSVHMCIYAACVCVCLCVFYRWVMVIHSWGLARSLLCHLTATVNCSANFASFHTTWEFNKRSVYYCLHNITHNLPVPSFSWSDSEKSPRLTKLSGRGSQGCIGSWTDSSFVC